MHPVSDLQIEYSLISRGIEDGILEPCRSLDIGTAAYGVLSRGLISEHWRPGPGSNDLRTVSPRFQGENVAHNLSLVDALRKVADRKGARSVQLAIAWVAAQGIDFVPLVGARRREQLAEALGALTFTLDAEDLADIESAVPNGAAAGDRYARPLLSELGSEKRPS